MLCTAESQIVASRSKVSHGRTPTANRWIALATISKHSRSSTLAFHGCFWYDFIDFLPNVELLLLDSLSHFHWDILDTLPFKMLPESWGRWISISPYISGHSNSNHSRCRHSHVCFYMQSAEKEYTSDNQPQVISGDYLLYFDEEIDDEHFSIYTEHPW